MTGEAKPEVCEARRPVLYTEPCEGRQASPSNPNQVTEFASVTASAREAAADTKPKLSPRQNKSRREGFEAYVVFRCTALEKTMLLGQAERSGQHLSGLMREALGLVDAKRRRPVPKADPALIREVGRIGGNLNQIARWLNAAVALGHAREIDALKVATRLAAIERALSDIATSALPGPTERDQPRC